MRISLRQLMVFDHIARLGSVSRAAAEIPLSQSAASMALKELEAHLGIDLFHRRGKSLSINENGRKLQIAARSILHQIREIEAEAENRPLRGRITVAASTTIGNYLLPAICTRFMELYPDTRINLLVHTVPEVIQLTSSLTVSLGFIEANSTASDLVNRPLYKDRLVLFVSKDNPLAKRGTLSPEDLAGVQWCLRERVSTTRMIFVMAIQKHIENLDVAFESNSSLAVKKAVMNSNGVGCLSRHTIRDELESGDLVVLDVPALALDRQFRVIMPRGLYQGTLINCFLDFAIEEMMKTALDI